MITTHDTDPLSTDTVKVATEPQLLTWYCNSGHNTLETDQYTLDYPPECGSCGCMMNTSPTSGYDDALQRLEEEGIKQH